MKKSDKMRKGHTKGNREEETNKNMQEAHQVKAPAPERDELLRVKSLFESDRLGVESLRGIEAPHLDEPRGPPRSVLLRAAPVARFREAKTPRTSPSTMERLPLAEPPPPRLYALLRMCSAARAASLGGVPVSLGGMSLGGRVRDPTE